MDGAGRSLSFGKAIICVGGHPRRLNFPGSELAIVHNEVWSLDHLPQSIAIIGASATGCQLASIFSAFGAQVTLLEVANRVLPQEDELTSQVVGDVFARRKINLINQIEAIQSITREQGDMGLRYRKNGDDQFLQVKAVLMAAGWVGNIEDLGLDAAGVVSEKTYIPVNDFLQTTSPNIFAAGDITGRMMLVQSGSYEGRIAAENAVLGTGQPQKHQIVPHGGFTDPEYAGVGLTEKQARVVENDPVVVVVPYKSLDRAVIDGLTEGFCKLIVSNENHRILGAHIVGEQAVELAQTVAAGMAADMWVEHLADLELAYPTYTSILGLAARRAAAIMGTMPLTPAWRVFENTPVSEWERIQD